MNYRRSAVSIRKTLMHLAFKALCLVVILSANRLLNAQTFYGAVVGVVTDSSGALVPNAMVTIKNLGTSEINRVQTDAGGKFSVVNLVPATYSVTVEKTGFKRFVQEDVPVQVGGTIRIDTALVIGTEDQVVEVTDRASQLQTDSSSLSTVVEGEQVQEMPLNGRNVMNLLSLVPGVIANGGASGSTGMDQQGNTRTAGGLGWGNYQIGGAIQGEGAQFIDGALNNFLGYNVVALVPTQDAVQEFNVLSSVATADFGRYGGGVVNMTTRSGTNSFHGTAYEYLRNTDFNANTWFNNHTGNIRNHWNQNQYGGRVTGPIFKDKVFFMSAYEGFRETIGVNTSTNVITAAMQNGTFSRPIADPRGNCNILNNGNGTYSITNLYGPSAAGGLDATCGDPLNRILKTYYPTPNNSSTSSNWFINTPLSDAQNQYNERVDVQTSQNNRIFARYTHWSVSDSYYSPFDDQGYNGATWATSNIPNSLFTQQAVIGDTYTFNPTTILDVRADWSRMRNPDIPEQLNANESQFDQYNPNKYYTALAPQMALHTNPGYVLNGADNLWSFTKFGNYSIFYFNNYHLSGDLVKILGPHTFKFGAESRLTDSSSTGYVGGAAGQYTYTAAFTQVGGSSATGDEFASFLMGYPTVAAFQTYDLSATYEYYTAMYVTDTWQATHNLTLNLGLRYDLPGAEAERNNKDSVLLPHAVDPYTGITGTLALVNSPLYPSRGFSTNSYSEFQPRIGFSYRATPTTVVHGGFGVAYLPNDLFGVYGAGTGAWSNAYLNLATTQVNASTPIPLQTTLGCLAGAISFTATNSPCTVTGLSGPGIVQPRERNVPNFTTTLGSLSTYKGQVVLGPVPYQPHAYTEQWNLAVSHQFPGELLTEVSYAALHGANLPGQSIGGQNGTGPFGLDELSSQYYSLGPTVLAAKTGAPAATAAGFATCPNAPGLAAGAITVGQCLRPYPYYNNVFDTQHYGGYQNYHSIQMKLEKRFKSAGLITANYVYAKNMANADTISGNLESSSGTTANVIPYIQDFNNLAAEYSLIGFDVKNRFVASYLVNLPFGKGKKYANALGDVGNALVSGWDVEGITTLQSGFPEFFLNVTPNNLTSNYGGGQLRPSVVPGCNKKITGSNQTRVLEGSWFNKSCFVQATTAADPTGLVSLGNEPRVDPDLRSDGIKNFDISLQKVTPIHEAISFTLRAEFFNAFNRVQFGVPNPQFTTAATNTFGSVNYQANQPRQIQFSGRINF